MYWLTWWVPQNNTIAGARSCLAHYNKFRPLRSYTRENDQLNFSAPCGFCNISILILSLPRVINFTFLLQPNRNITSHTVGRTWLFIAYSDERWPYFYQFSLHHSWVGRMYFLNLGVKGSNVSDLRARIPRDWVGLVPKENFYRLGHSHPSKVFKVGLYTSSWKRLHSLQP